MKDKYEEFKSWILESNLGFHKIARIQCENSHIINIKHMSAEFICFDCKDLFEQFEKYLEQTKNESPFTNTICTPISSFSTEFNIYHRTAIQLKAHLRKHDFPVDMVCRSEVGEKSYYNVGFNVKEDEWASEKTSHMIIRKLLGIEHVDLVDFYRHEGIIHQVILIDEAELNDKYLKNGNLVFEK